MIKNKVLIIEGVDNTGKDSLINEISKHFNKTKIYHFISPSSYDSSSNDPVLTQKKQFSSFFDNIRKDLKNDKIELIILNRSHLGEYVYGPLYRDSNPNWIFEEFEKKYEDVLEQTSLVLLTSPANHSIKYDDGFSFSTNINNRIKELILFEEALRQSLIKHKKIINVYNEKIKDFKKRDFILTEVINFLKK